jgi:hypothetical protein
MPDRQPPIAQVDAMDIFKRAVSNIVEHTMFTVEISFVVEHRIDRVVEQLAAVRGHECGDERVEIADAVPLHHRFQRHLDAPDAVRRQRLPGPRFEHAHQHAISRLARRPAHHDGRRPGR